VRWADGCIINGGHVRTLAEDGKRVCVLLELRKFDSYFEPHGLQWCGIGKPITGNVREAWSLGHQEHSVAVRPSREPGETSSATEDGKENHNFQERVMNKNVSYGQERALQQVNSGAQRCEVGQPGCHVRKRYASSDQQGEGQHVTKQSSAWRAAGWFGCGHLRCCLPFREKTRSPGMFKETGFNQIKTKTTELVIVRA
jgi:hypothetical protein